MNDARYFQRGCPPTDSFCRNSTRSKPKVSSVSFSWNTPVRLINGLAVGFVVSSTTGTLVRFPCASAQTLQNRMTKSSRREPRKMVLNFKFITVTEKGTEVYRKKKKGQPPATILTISSLSPGASWRLENSDGATASPLCSTTTLRGKRFWARRNSLRVHGNSAWMDFPLARIWLCEGINF